jgi:hypothetical protein
MLQEHSHNGHGSHHLTVDVLHQMLLRSRSERSKRMGGKHAASNRYSVPRTLPNGDPPEVTLWGDA